jgi:hypothetical protein
MTLIGVHEIIGLPYDHTHPSGIHGNFPVKTLVARQWPTIIIISA